MLVVLFAGSSLPAVELPIEASLREQFMQIADFEQLQNPAQQITSAEGVKAAKFFDSLQEAEDFDENIAESWAGFFELTLACDDDANFARRLQILQREGEKQFAAIPPEMPD